MEQINLSPANQALIQQKQQVAPNPQIEVKPKQIKDGKKLLIAGATAAAAIGVATILIATHKTHKLKKILAESESIQKTSEEIIEKGQKLHDEAQGVVDEILDLFNKGKASNFTDVLDENGNVIVKYNLNSDGELDTIIQTGIEGFKKGYFIDDSLETIEIAHNNGSLDEIEICRRKITSILKNTEEFADGSGKIQEQFKYRGGKLVGFTIGLEGFADGSVKAQETFDFEDGKLACFIKGLEGFADGSEKAQETFDFEYGKLACFIKGLEGFADGSVKAQETFVRIGGKLQDVTNKFNAN